MVVVPVATTVPPVPTERDEIVGVRQRNPDAGSADLDGRAERARRKTAGGGDGVGGDARGREG